MCLARPLSEHRRIKPAMLPRESPTSLNRVPFQALSLFVFLVVVVVFVFVPLTPPSTPFYAVLFVSTDVFTVVCCWRFTVSVNGGWFRVRVRMEDR